MRSTIYKVIIECDILLHISYITAGYKSKIYNMNTRCSRAEGKSRELQGKVGY